MSEADKISETVSDAVDSVKDKLGDLADNAKVHDVVEDAKEKIGDLKDKFLGNH
ncbi:MULTISPECIES: hypothetical protein [unclassified Gordonia (in: high G+C Gram-positive bacteria)]